MYIDCENPEQYFIGDPSSVSIVMAGKSKRKLKPIKVSLWKPIHKKELAEIDGNETTIQYSYVGLEITGATKHKNIIEGFTDLEAIICTVSCIHSVISEFIEETGHYLYQHNFAGEEWCKVDLDEMFYGLSASY